MNAHNLAEQIPMESIVEHELERCKKWINDALNYANGTHDFEDVAKEVKVGTMQLWSGEKGCAVTQILIYPKKKVLHVFLAGGEMNQIIDFQASAVEFGKINGCTAISLAGRKGWAKVLAKHGWSEQFTVLGMEF